jgi:hypothetical protein
MRVLVTGSRDWRDFDTIWNRLSELPPSFSIIVHGAATGADHMCHSAAIALGFSPEPHFPDYALYPVNVAPLKRNEKMVDLGADLCLAFPTASSRGTWHCYNLAKEAGIPCEIVS